jgi:hypothetical protein
MKSFPEGDAANSCSARLKELRAEFERGQQQMVQLDLHRTELRDTLLRINGAIQVLEEMLKASVGQNGGAASLPASNPRTGNPPHVAV